MAGTTSEREGDTVTSRLWDAFVVLLSLLAGWGALKVVAVHSAGVSLVEFALVGLPVAVLVYWGVHHFVLNHWRRSALVGARS